MNVWHIEGVEEEDGGIRLLQEFDIALDIVYIGKILTRSIIEDQIDIVALLLGDLINERYLALWSVDIGLRRAFLIAIEHIEEVALITVLCVVGWVFGHIVCLDTQTIELQAAMALQLIDEGGDIYGLAAASGTYDGDNNMRKNMCTCMCNWVA